MSASARALALACALAAALASTAGVAWASPHDPAPGVDADNADSDPNADSDKEGGDPDDAGLAADPDDKARATPRKKKKKARTKRKSRLPEVHTLVGRRWMFLMPIEASLAGGALSGFRLLDQRGPFVEGSLSAAPSMRYQRGKLLLALPVELAHRQPFEHDIQWTHASAGLSLDARVRDDVEVGAKLRGLWKIRPSWPDLYQPILDDKGLPTGSLNPTARYSRNTLDADAHAQWRLDDLRLFASAGFERLVATKDPNFDPILRPTHLTPPDSDRWSGRLGVDGGADPWRWRVEARAAHVAHAFDFARDAGTGLTHAAPGALPPNPLARFTLIGLGHRSTFQLRTLKTRLTLDLDIDHNRDAFDGYQTWTQLGLSPALRLKPAPRWRIDLGASARWRRYTPDGYQAGPTHAPLDDGDSVRAAATLRFEAELAHTLKATPVTFFVNGQRLDIDTNFPDYTPTLNPPGTALDVDQDTLNIQVMAGARAEF